MTDERPKLFSVCHSMTATATATTIDTEAQDRREVQPSIWCDCRNNEQA
jgi:hypothetical protein